MARVYRTERLIGPRHDPYSISTITYVRRDGRKVDFITDSLAESTNMTEEEFQREADGFSLDDIKKALYRLELREEPDPYGPISRYI